MPPPRLTYLQAFGDDETSVALAPTAGSHGDGRRGGGDQRSCRARRVLLCIALFSALGAATGAVVSSYAAHREPLCVSALHRDCAAARAGGGDSSCMYCAGAHQAELHQAGCTAGDITDFCNTPPNHTCANIPGGTPDIFGYPAAQLSPPTDDSAAGIASWHASLRRWRDSCQAALNLTGAGGRSKPLQDQLPGLRWAETSYIQVQMHPWDRFLWNGTHHTVTRYLQDLVERYGGIDSVLICKCDHTEPPPPRPTIWFR
jgi:hypothetical protein